MDGLANAEPGAGRRYRQAGRSARLGRLPGQLVGWPQPDQMRPVADRDASIQMFMDRHHAPSQAVTPASLWDLKHAPLQQDGVVLIDGALML